jgi:tetratricopeptide (TPR) repeat protein
VHPVANRAFARVGSYMAARLREKYGDSKLALYPSSGGLVFFQDYIALTGTDATIPTAFRFNQGFAQMASEMARDWSRSNSEYVRQLSLMPDSDFDDVGKKLRQSFAGTTVYPNLVDPLFGVTRQLILNKDSARALKASELASELYPEAAEANLVHGIALIVNGDSGRAQTYLKKAASINPNGPASAGALNNVAYQLLGVGMVEQGMAVLRAAIELHPQEANLYDSLGEFHLNKGEKAKALELYKKALETDPNFGNAANAREIVKKLTAELGGQ